MRPRVTTPFGGTEPADISHIIEALGAVELDPAQVPEHWGQPLPPGQEFAIFLEGRNAERPDWSRREARSLAETALTWRAYLLRIRDLAKSQGRPVPVVMPRWHGVAVCLVCHELQIVQSNQTKNDLCWACQGRCRLTHRPNVRACDGCRSEMEVLWTTDQDLPTTWM